MHELNEKQFETFYVFELEYLKGAGTITLTELYLQLCEGFQSRFPDSPHLSSILPIMQESKAFLDKASTNNEGQVFLNTSGFNSLEDIKVKFTGQPLYIDMWATWCKPCLAEFSRQDQVHKLLDKKDVAIVERFELQGHHLLASKSLIQDIWSNVGNIGVKGYPRYILLDDDGEFQFKNAARPSQIKQLETQLKALK